MKKVSRAVVAVNVCGAIGYMLLLTVWALFLAIILGLLFDAAEGPSPADVVQTSGRSSPTAPAPVVVVASYILTGVIALLCAAIVVTWPYFIGKWGSRLLKGLMKLCRIDVTKRQLFFVKGIIIVLPLIGLLIVNFVIMPESMTFAAMYAATVALAAGSLALFFVQLWLARRLHVPVDRVW